MAAGAVVLSFSDLPPLPAPADRLGRGIALATLFRQQRELVNAVVTAAKEDRDRLRQRPRKRGERTLDFWDDPDRFALALMTAHMEGMIASDRSSLLAAAEFAVVFFSPGEGRKLEFTEPRDGRVSLRLGSGSHDTPQAVLAKRASYMVLKFKRMTDVQRLWCRTSANALQDLYRIGASARAHRVHRLALAQLAQLGWTRIPRPAVDRVSDIVSALAGALT